MRGLTLYFLCGPDSQKPKNLAVDPRVSITIDHDEPQVMRSPACPCQRARRGSKTQPKRSARCLLIARYPQQGETPGELPPASAVAIFRVSPAMISVLDYSKGFGHAEPTAC